MAPSFSSLDTVFCNSLSALLWADKGSMVISASMIDRYLRMILLDVVGFKYAVQLDFIGYQNRTWLAAIGLAHNAYSLKLVHETACTVVTDCELALYQ